MLSVVVPTAVAALHALHTWGGGDNAAWNRTQLLQVRVNSDAAAAAVVVGLLQNYLTDLGLSEMFVLDNQLSSEPAVGGGQAVWVWENKGFAKAKEAREQQRKQQQQWERGHGLRPLSAITCPPAEPAPPPSQLRVVSDISAESDVALLADTLVSGVSRYGGESADAGWSTASVPPRQAGSRQDAIDALCPESGLASNRGESYPFCEGNPSLAVYKCDTRHFVAAVPCAYIDHDSEIPGLVFDQRRTFPVHGCHPHGRDFQPNPVTHVVQYPEIGHTLQVLLFILCSLLPLTDWPLFPLTVFPPALSLVSTH